MTGKTILSAAAVALALALGGCSTIMGERGDSMGQSGMSSDAMPMGAMPTDAMGYVAMAGASDLYEIQSSQLHHQRGVNPKLHAFATMMIDHHSRTTEATMASARAAQMSPPPPMLMPMQQQMIARLQALSGAAFDREYARQQVMAHEMALALHQNYARSGDTPSLRLSASSAVPVVRGHLDQIRGMRM